MDEWEFCGVCFAEAPFEIGKIENVWEHEWQDVKGESAHVKDPEYGQDYVFHIYRIVSGKDEIEFAVGEFSNQAWGFFTRRP